MSISSKQLAEINKCKNLVTKENKPYCKLMKKRAWIRNCKNCVTKSNESMEKYLK